MAKLAGSSNKGCVMCQGNKKSAKDLCKMYKAGETVQRLDLAKSKTDLTALWSMEQFGFTSKKKKSSAASDTSLQDNTITTTDKSSSLSTTFPSSLSTTTTLKPARYTSSCSGLFKKKYKVSSWKSNVDYCKKCVVVGNIFSGSFFYSGQQVEEHLCIVVPKTCTAVGKFCGSSDPQHDNCFVAKSEQMKRAVQTIRD
eukprot:5300217-Ditylum_brightwellii.AAC.1